MEHISSSIAIFAPAVRKKEQTDIGKMELKESQKHIYNKVYAECFSKISAYAFSFLKDTEEANNIAHDTFLSLWENRDTLNWNESLAPWLFSVSRNKCLNVLKKRVHSNNFRKESMQEKTEYLNFLALQSDRSATIYEKEVEVLLSKAVEKMTPKVRDTFILSRMKGMKYSEIAKNGNISNRTVEARIKLAMLVLRKTFKDYL